MYDAFDVDNNATVVVFFSILSGGGCGMKEHRPTFNLL
jgi:hypothetical protein